MLRESSKSRFYARGLDECKSLMRHAVPPCGSPTLCSPLYQYARVQPPWWGPCARPPKATGGGRERAPRVPVSSG